MIQYRGPEGFLGTDKATDAQKRAVYNFRFVNGVMWNSSGRAAAVHNFKRAVALLQLSCKHLKGRAFPRGHTDEIGEQFGVHRVVRKVAFRNKRTGAGRRGAEAKAHALAKFGIALAQELTSEWAAKGLGQGCPTPRPLRPSNRLSYSPMLPRPFSFQRVSRPMALGEGGLTQVWTLLSCGAVRAA